MRVGWNGMVIWWKGRRGGRRVGRGIVGGREDRIKGRLVSRRIVVDGGRLRVVWELLGSKIGRGERLGDGWVVGI